MALVQAVWGAVSSVSFSQFGSTDGITVNRVAHAVSLRSAETRAYDIGAEEY
jgi:hypothetical protein